MDEERKFSVNDVDSGSDNEHDQQELEEDWEEEPSAVSLVL